MIISVMKQMPEIFFFFFFFFIFISQATYNIKIDSDKNIVVCCFDNIKEHFSFYWNLSNDLKNQAVFSKKIKLLEKIASHYYYYDFDLKI